MNLNKFEWIDLDAVPILNHKKIVIFGAGYGAIEFIQFINKTDSTIEITGIVDNDETLWGRHINHCPVVAPSHLTELDFDLIVVTSISGAESISLQLEKKGYERNSDFVLIGKYPDGWKGYFHKIKALKDKSIDFCGKRCLHIGPGGFLGLETLMYCYGAQSIQAIDKFMFGIQYPDITQRFQDYLTLRQNLDWLGCDEDSVKLAERRFDKLFLRNGDKVMMNHDKISYLYPHDICDLPIEDNSFDIVLSFAVLEHVNEPQMAVNEIFRVLKPGGKTYHRIVTADHRSFSTFNEFNEFSFRSYSDEEWHRISNRKFYQNRVIPASWKQLFQKTGLEMIQYSVEKQIDVDDKMFNLFSNDFLGFNREDLGAVNCEMVLKKSP